MENSKVLTVFRKFDTLEYQLCRHANGYCRNRALKSFFSTISRLGDGVFWYACMLILPVIDPQFGLSMTLNMLAAGLVCLMLYKTLKRKLGRERPYINFQNIDCGTPPLDRYSFPSGHTLHAVCFTLMLAVYVPLLAWLVLPFMLLVMMSRVILGLHYPSDVAMGAIIGASIGAAAVALMPLFEIRILS